VEIIMKFVLLGRSTTSALLAAALIFTSLPEAMEARVLLSSPLVYPQDQIQLVKGTGGIKKPFNNAANPSKPPRKWTTKPKYPLWTGSKPPPPPAPALKPKGFVTAKPTKPPHSRLPQHFNYNAQRPLRFDFNKAAK